jgi:type III pantothenate kinase
MRRNSLRIVSFDFTRYRPVAMKQGLLLAIDIGNTHTMVGVYDSARLRLSFRLYSDRRRTVDEYRVLVSRMLSDGGIEQKSITDAIISSVVPPLTVMWRQLCADALALATIVLGPGTRTGMPIRCDNPREVGADRIANGVGGYEKYRRQPGGPIAVLVVDFGTATTFDVVSPEGEYLGGAIAPGVEMAAEALFLRASKLPRVDLEYPETVVGRNTITSMQSGILYGYAGLVEGLVGRIKAELPYTPRVLATGGVAPLVAKAVTCLDDVDPLVTLEGLRIIHERQRKAS